MRTCLLMPRYHPVQKVFMVAQPPGMALRRFSEPAPLPACESGDRTGLPTLPILSVRQMGFYYNLTPPAIR